MQMSTRTRTLGHALALVSCASMTLAGCEREDPLVVIRQLQEAGDYRGSIEPLRELIANRPDDAEAHYRYGLALVVTQQPNLSIWSLRKAMEDPEWLIPAATQLTLKALAAGNFREAVALTTRMLEHDPDNVRALLLRANAYAHWKDDPEAALADAGRALELDPDALEAYEPRILALLSLDRLDEATEQMAEAGRRLRELGSDKVDPRVLAWHCSTTALFDQENGDLDRARQTWNECLESHPADEGAVSSALEFFDGLGEPEHSIEILRAALAAAPTSRNFRLSLAQRLNLSGDRDAAEALLLEAAQAEGPGQAAAWMDLGLLRQRSADYGGSADAIERAFELARAADIADPQVWFQYADALVLAGRFDRALEIADELTVPAHRHLIRGRVAQERRMPTKALEEFDQALVLWPDNPWARYYAALAAEELGDFPRALEEYRYATRISPGATDSRRRGAELLLARGQPSAALQMIQAGSDEFPLDLEGKLLLLRLLGHHGESERIAKTLSKIDARYPTWSGFALAEAAQGLADEAGPAVALSMVQTAPGIDFAAPRFAAALRAAVRFAHEAGASGETRAILNEVLAANPDSSVHHEIRGLDLELSGAPAEQVRAAYERALELGPANALAMAGLGRLSLESDPAAALGWFDQASAIDQADPAPRIGAARALLASGEPDRAARRLDALLIEHPYETEAAQLRARLDVDQGLATLTTLERAQRAARLGGTPEAFELLSEVHALRDEPEQAARAAEHAKGLREGQAAPS